MVVIPLELQTVDPLFVGATGNPVPIPEPRRLEFEASLDRRLLPREIGS